MSKPQPASEVLRSIDNRRLSPWTGPGVGGLLLLVGGCLSANIGAEGTTQVILSSSSSADDSSGSTAGTGIMTTTEDPDRTTGDSSGSGSAAGTETGDSASDGTTGIPETCGDGVVQQDEGCDAGPANADDGACTSHCKPAACGDGFVQAGVEVCDDGKNDGSYNGCAVDCMAQGPRCGDGVLQGPEKCDDADPKSGCLPETCNVAKSCKQIKDAYPDVATDGLHTIAPLGTKLQVICDMDADGGGYTFLKVAQAAPMSAMEAENECVKYGMRLLAPRSKAHLTATVQVAKSDVLAPVGPGVTKASLNYLKIFGIYPKVFGQSCIDKPFNNVDCPQWTAEGDIFWITSQPVPAEPGTKTCVNCSLAYYWNPDGTFLAYESVSSNNEASKSDLFMCTLMDKLPPLN